MKANTLNEIIDILKQIIEGTKEQENNLGYFLANYKVRSK